MIETTSIVGDTLQHILKSLPLAAAYISYGTGTTIASNYDNVDDSSVSLQFRRMSLRLAVRPGA